MSLLSDKLQQKLQQKKEKPKKTTTKTTTSVKRPSKYELLDDKFNEFKNEIDLKLQQLLQQKLQSVSETGILFEITDPSEYDAVKFAIAKCMNLFKASKYDSPSSSMKSFKENWEEITKRENWNKKKEVGNNE